MAREEVARLNIRGQWDIEDLSDLSEAIKETYAYFYALTHCDNDEIEYRIKNELQRYFWSGDYKGRHFAQRLYWTIPRNDRVKIYRMQYASPGYLELMALVNVLILISLAVRSYAKTGTAIIGLVERIDEFFYRRRLRRPARNFDTSQLRKEDYDDAYQLMQELGQYLGFTSGQIARVEELTGNPISGLKMMVALATETRRLQELEAAGKLRLPDPPTPAD